jgi:microcystin-dependent protein
VSFTKTTWVDDSAPAITATQLNRIEDGIASAMPAGGIILWSGSVGAVPTGWALCNGSNGTPDLRDRFVVGAGNNYSVGDNGGSGSGTAGQKQNITAVSANPNQTMSVTVANHTLTESQIPSHRHSYNRGRSFGNDEGDLTGFTGGGGAHSHGATLNNASHTHNTTLDVRPPYYALAYIMKL